MAIDQAQLWKEYARVYSRLRALSPYRNLLFEIIACARPGHDTRLLDLCCGDGGLLWALNASGYHCEVTALDKSEAMLGQARTEPYAGPVEFIAADLDQPISNWGLFGRYDRFICNNGLYALRSPASVLRRLHSHATSKAVLVVSTPGPDADPQALLAEHLQGLNGEELPHERHRLQKLLAPVAGYNEKICAELGTRAFHAPDEPQLRHWFESSGWQIAEIRRTYAGQNWLVIAERR